MARTLIESPFPSTAEVARKLGVSSERVREVERLMADVSVRPINLKARSQNSAKRRVTVKQR